MSATVRRAAAPLLMIAAGFGLLAWWTSGFRAFTTDSHALAVAGLLPRPAPVFQITDQSGRTYDTAQLRGRWVLLTFVYLNCTGVCYLSLAKFDEVHRDLHDIVPARLTLLSISFDPQRDTVASLHHLWEVHGQPNGWIMARLTTPLGPQTQAQLRRIGVWVRRQPDGEYSHATSTFLLDPTGTVVQVFRAETPVADMVRALRDRTG
jgi:protein SCO1